MLATAYEFGEALGQVLGCIAVCYLYYHFRFKRKYEETPNEIQEICRNVHTGTFELKYARYKPDKEAGARKTFKKKYVAQDGSWNVSVETENNIIVAYRAVFQPRNKIAKGHILEGYCKPPEILE